MGLVNVFGSIINVTRVNISIETLKTLTFALGYHVTCKQTCPYTTGNWLAIPPSNNSRIILPTIYSSQHLPFVENSTKVTFEFQPEKCAVNTSP